MGFKSFSSSENGHLPLEGIINRNASGTPAKGLRDKRVIEQWIVTVILMGLITFIITVTIYFANYITDISSTYKIKHRDINAITIYVKSDNDNSLKKNYYFKTSIEGMLMFQTQYKWKAHPLKNIINGLGGAVIAIFKGFLLALFAIRMVLVAILIVIAPIVVIINGFLKVYGNRGILGTWYKIFLYMCLLKPLIAIVYYILVKCNVYLVNEFSLYLVFVVAIIMIAFYASARWLLKSLRSNRQQYE